MASLTKIGDSWRCTVRFKNQPQKSKTFHSKADAKKWGDDLEYMLRHSAPVEITDYTVGQLLDQYEQTRLLANREIKSASNTAFMISHLRDGFGDKVAAKVTHADYIRWVETALTKGRGKNGLGMELALLQTVFRRAEEKHNTKLPQHLKNAIGYLKTTQLIRTTTSHRERIVTEDELSDILMALPTDELKSIVQLTFILGFRREEITKLEWKNINEERKIIWVRNRKHPSKKIGNDDEVPLILGTYDLIQRQPKTSERIFPSYSPENISDWFLKACRKEELLGIVFHSLRHTAITRLFQIHKLPMVMVARISGHKDFRHLQRYTHIDSAAIHDLVREYA